MSDEQLKFSFIRDILLYLQLKPYLSQFFETLK